MNITAMVVISLSVLAIGAFGVYLSHKEKRP
jgi:hypothetical protein